MRYKWGVDLGGTKIEGAIIDAANGMDVIARLRLPTESHLGYNHILNQINSVVKALEKETGITPAKIGMGTPGVMDPRKGTLKNSNTTCLNGKPLQRDIESLTGLKFKLSNDANCFAIAETLIGAVQDLDVVPEVVFGVIMGTGVGGGLVVNGKIINGRHSLGGEWGHNVLEPEGTPCFCGKRGCTEQVISGPALERYYTKLTNEKRALKEIYQRKKSNQDTHALATIDYLIDNFGRGISSLINTIDPDVIILGGGVGNIPDLQNRAAEAALPYVFNDSVETTFLRPKLGDSAGVFGAALLWE